MKTVDQRNAVEAEVLRKMGYKPEEIVAGSVSEVGFDTFFDGIPVGRSWTVEEYEFYRGALDEAMRSESSNDPVNHPSHYTSGKIEVIDFIEDQGLGFHEGNVVKYVARAGKKDPTKLIQDLEKASWYLNRRIAQLKEGLE